MKEQIVDFDWVHSVMCDIAEFLRKNGKSEGAEIIENAASHVKSKLDIGFFHVEEAKKEMPTCEVSNVIFSEGGHVGRFCVRSRESLL